MSAISFIRNIADQDTHSAIRPPNLEDQTKLFASLHPEETSACA